MSDAALATDHLIAALRAAGEPTRLRILVLLAQGELTVTELTQILRQSQPRVSRHLKLLGDAGLLTRFREGAWVFHRLADSGALNQLSGAIIDLADDRDDEFARDLERLEEVRARRAAEAAAFFSAHADDWGRIRALYVSETEVEQAILAELGNRRPDRLLDIGTGTGRILALLADRISHGLGLDLSPDMLTVARAGLAKAGVSHCQVRLGDMYDLPVANDSQDLLIFHQVLHFADDPALALREAGRVLAKGGLCLVVDFAPHDKEFLRDEQAHRRLGFGDDEIANWAHAAHLETAKISHLAGGALTVTLWRLEKPAAQQLEAAQ